MFKKNKQPNKKPFNRKKNYSRDREENQDFSDLPKVIGIYSQARNSDFGFIDVAGLDKGYFVYPKNLGTAFDGDEVEAFVKTFNGRKEAVITKVLKRADRVLVGTLQLKKSFGFVILDNPLFKKDIFIPYKNLEQHKNLKDGYKVAIKITKWEAKNPEGKIFEVLGDKNKAGVDIESLILEAGLKTRFPQIVTDEAEKLKFEEKGERVDLTDTLVFTIDGEDAKDLDDAISIEKITPPVIDDIPLDGGGEAKGNGARGSYKLIISIADVSEYVKDESFLNKEALKRGNSTYLPDRVIPMLPEKISNDLCSLNPNTKKLSLSCEILIDKSGKIVSKKVYESIISSKFRLTYKEVQEIIEEKLKIGDKLIFGGVVNEELFEKIKLSNELKQIIEKKKKISGVLDFDFPEIKIILDKENNPIEIKKYERFDSHKIIEQFMILANESVGELFSKIPFLYRIHPIPKEDDIEKLRKTLGLFDIKLAYKKLTPLLISQILEEIKKSPKERLLSKLVLRSLEKAIYSHENEGHFGLGLEFYSHFTSPIRRYPDLIIHRIIKEKLHNKLDNKRIEYYKSILKNIGKKTSDTERASEKLEYNVKDLFICKYYKDKIGLEEKGIISGIIPAGVFIELENGVEGFLSLDNILLSKNIKKAVYEEEFMRFALGNNQFLQIGDEVKIKLSGIDDERRRLLFDLVQ